MPTTALEAPRRTAKRVMKEPDTKTKEKELRRLKIVKSRRADLSLARESGTAIEIL
jgi:hypothetical protein